MLPGMEKDPALIRLGMAVRARRLALGLTQEALGERTDFHPNYIGMVERGERNPTYTNVLRFARGLGCPAGDLVTQAEGALDP